MTATPAAAPPRQAVILLGAGAALVLWSGTAIANKVAVGHMDPMTAGILRSLLAGLIAAAIAAAVRLPLPGNRAQWALLVVSGITSFAIWPMMLSLAVEQSAKLFHIAQHSPEPWRFVSIRQHCRLALPLFEGLYSMCLHLPPCARVLLQATQ